MIFAIPELPIMVLVFLVCMVLSVSIYLVLQTLMIEIISRPVLFRMMSYVVILLIIISSLTISYKVTTGVFVVNSPYNNTLINQQPSDQAKDQKTRDQSQDEHSTLESSTENKINISRLAEELRTSVNVDTSNMYYDTERLESIGEYFLAMLEYPNARYFFMLNDPGAAKKRSNNNTVVCWIFTPKTSGKERTEHAIIITESLSKLFDNDGVNQLSHMHKAGFRTLGEFWNEYVLQNIDNGIFMLASNYEALRLLVNNERLVISDDYRKPLIHIISDDLVREMSSEYNDEEEINDDDDVIDTHPLK